jgi:hypothetical protein
MNRLALLLFSGLAAVGIVIAGCSSKDDATGTPLEDDLCEAKDKSAECAPTAAKKPTTTKKDAGTSGPAPTPTPTPPPSPASDAGATQDSGTPIPHPTAPRDVCVDLANTVALALQQKCKALFADEWQAFVNAAAGGDCRNIKSIRDIDALYSDCVPWIQRASCADLQNASAIPDSCKGQLLP